VKRIVRIFVRVYIINIYIAGIGAPDSRCRAIIIYFRFYFFVFGWGGRNTNNIRASRSTVINRAIFDVQIRTRARKMPALDAATEKTLISSWTQNLQETSGKKISILDSITIIIIIIIIIIRYVLPTHAYTGRYMHIYLYIYI